VYLTACSTLSSKAYIPLHRLPLKTLLEKMLFFISIGYGHDAIKRLQERAANL
jgi:hypothetical protein